MIEFIRQRRRGLDPETDRTMPIGSWFVTSAGRRFFPLAPRADDVTIDDIAHALSHVCRYGGHCREFYSVAQHSVHVSRLVPPRLAFHGLMHDAAEAYVGDMVRPLKRCLPAFSAIEARIFKAIAERFGLEPLSEEDAAIVKHFDSVALVTERRDLVFFSPLHAWKEDEQGFTPDPAKITALPVALARLEFHNRFLEVRP